MSYGTGPWAATRVASSNPRRLDVDVAPCAGNFVPFQRLGLQNSCEKAAGVKGRFGPTFQQIADEPIGRPQRIRSRQRSARSPKP